MPASFVRERRQTRPGRKDRVESRAKDLALVHKKQERLNKVTIDVVALLGVKGHTHRVRDHILN